MANHRDAPPERGTFFKPQIYERVGISLNEEYERVGNSVIWLSFMALSSREKTVKDSAFTAVKRDVKFSTRYMYVKGVPFVNRGYTEGVPFS